MGVNESTLAPTAETNISAVGRFSLSKHSMKPFLIGRVVKRVITPQGGDFFIILADGPTSKRFRADARLFARPEKVEPDTLVSFYPAEGTKQASKLLRIRQIVFEPQTDN